MAAVITHRDLYIDIRRYLIKTLGISAEDEKQVIQAYQNSNPLPADAVVMTILFERPIDSTFVNYKKANEQKAIVQQAREATVQLDFYGSLAQTRSQKIALLWKTSYSLRELKKCAPLYTKEPRRIPIVNEQNNYEDRWSLDCLLQYDPEVEHEQDYITEPPTISLTNLNP
ncbi:hypothetical protein AAEX37_01957 [Oligella sp. MSHR50489EDL]|uniref:phage neck terminator protein n=1 Tax=Oligella sp. MSHR50489EDL TaxID=3139409 RepID=UPI003D81AF98